MFGYGVAETLGDKGVGLLALRAAWEPATQWATDGFQYAQLLGVLSRLEPGAEGSAWSPVIAAVSSALREAPPDLDALFEQVRAGLQGPAPGYLDEHAFAGLYAVVRGWECRVDARWIDWTKKRWMSPREGGVAVRGELTRWILEWPADGSLSAGAPLSPLRGQEDSSD